MRGHINQINNEAVVWSYIGRYMDDYYQGILSGEKVIRLIGRRSGCGHYVASVLFNREKKSREKAMKLYGDFRQVQEVNQ
jgi:hypothetical protein